MQIALCEELSAFFNEVRSDPNANWRLAERLSGAWIRARWELTGSLEPRREHSVNCPCLRTEMRSRARSNGFNRALKWSGGDQRESSDTRRELLDFRRQTQVLFGVRERVVGMLMVSIELPRFVSARSLRSLGIGADAASSQTDPSGS